MENKELYSEIFLVFLVKGIFRIYNFIIIEILKIVKFPLCKVILTNIQYKYF